MIAPLKPVHEELQQATEAMLHALAATPDNRLLWSPHPSARNVLEIVAHSADSIGHLHRMMNLEAFSVPTTAAADEGFRAWECKFTTREAAISELRKRTDGYVGWLATLSDDNLDVEFDLPFGMGRLPRRIAIHFPARHTRHHLAQIEYLQTAFGDRDWHVPYG